MTDTMTMGHVSSSLIGLRGVLMLVAGLYAVAFPGLVLTLVVLLGGALLLLDGVLGLFGLTFGHAKTGNYWFDVVRNGLAVLTGVLILVSPLVATLLTVSFLIYIVALQAIVVGAMEMVVAARAREQLASMWPVLLSSIIYVLFGLMLIFWRISSALALITVGGVLLIVFAIGLFGLAMRLRKAGM
jgi:uncharacterized membrane protein HdeD (DUF308 family)